MAKQLDHDAYMALHDKVEAINTDFETIKCGTQEQRAVWEARRASFRHGRYPRPGTAETTKAALRVAHGQTLICRVPECRAIVDLQSARRVARTASRSRFELGDGCASRICSRKHWPARFHHKQLKMAASLRSGERMLVLWPESAESRVELSVAPAELTYAVSDGVANAESTSV